MPAVRPLPRPQQTLHAGLPWAQRPTSHRWPLGIHLNVWFTQTLIFLGGGFDLNIKSFG